MRLEQMARAVRSNCDDAKTEDHLRVEGALLEKEVLGSVIFRTPSDYYSWNLMQRAELLGTVPENLCKSLVLENKAIGAGGEEVGVRGAKYVIVVLQYLHKLDKDALGRRLAASEGGEYSFDVAPEDVSNALTGFGHNAVTVFGMREALPVVVSESITNLAPPLNYVWLGGGEVDLKLRIPVPQLLRATKATVVNCTTPRSADEARSLLYAE